MHNKVTSPFQPTPPILERIIPALLKKNCLPPLRTVHKSINPIPGKIYEFISRRKRNPLK